MKKSHKWWRLLGFNAGVSAVVGLGLGWLIARWFSGGLAVSTLIAVLVFVATNLVMLVWQYFRCHARWNYLEGMAWALAVFVLSAVPCLFLLFGANGSWGNSFFDALLMALTFSAPVLLFAPLVPLFWKRILEA
jgi:hypothetical protein